MSTDSELRPDLMRSEPRFSVGPEQGAHVTVSRMNSEHPADTGVELVDISRHGVKLRLPESPRFEQSLRLQVDVPNLGVHYDGIALVRNLRNDGDEGWLVGCSMDPPFSDAHYTQLAVASGMDRRDTPRQSISITATIQRQMETTTHEATLVNLSPGGVCVWSTRDFDAGDRLRISVVNADEEISVVEVRVCWRLDAPDGYVAGCRFENRSGFPKIEACCHQPTPQPVEPPQEAPRSASQIVLVAAVMAMALPPAITLLLQTGTAEAVVEPAVTVEAVESPEAESCWHRVPSQREWTDNTGQHQTIATLLDAQNDVALLRKVNGRWSKVPFSRLSPLDVLYIKQWQATRTEGPRP